MKFKSAICGGIFYIGTFTQNAFAMASRPNLDPNAPPPPAWISWFPVVFMVAVFYFLLIRPQMRQKKALQNMLSSVKKGDRIVTQGGLIGTVVNVFPTILEIKINEETKAKIKRSAVSEVLVDEVHEAEVVKEPVLTK